VKNFTVDPGNRRASRWKAVLSLMVDRQERLRRSATSSAKAECLSPFQIDKLRAFLKICGIGIAIWQDLFFLKDLFRGARQPLELKEEFVYVHVHVHVHGIRTLVAARPRWVIGGWSFSSPYLLPTGFFTFKHLIPESSFSPTDAVCKMALDKTCPV